MKIEEADWRSMPCEEWQGRLNENGYGRLPKRNGESGKYAHRLAWEECFGPIPDGLSVLHKCDNRKCRQPLHLFLGTRADNNRDMFAKGRNWQANVTHCPHGHEYTSENIYLDRGRKRCRICYNLKQKEKRRKRKECHERASKGLLG